MSDPAPHRPDRSTAQSTAGALLTIALTAAVAVALAWPMLVNSYLPLVDLPNHIARLYIAAHPGTELDRYYDYAFRAVPNAAADLLWAALGHPASASTFARLTMAFYAVNAVAATAVLSRVIWGRWSVWAAASGLLIYSAPFFWGFQNYLIGLPFALHAFALWLAIQRRSPWLRAAIFVPVGLILLYMHLFAFAILAVAATGAELQRLGQAPAGTRWAHLRRNLVLAVPFVLPMVALVWDMAGAGPNPAGTVTAFGGPRDRLYALISPFWDAGLARSAPDLNRAGLLALAVFAALMATTFRSQGPRLEIAPRMRGALLAMAALALLAPMWVNGVAYVHIRFPMVLGLMLVAASRWRDLSLPWRGMVAGAVALVLGLRVVLMADFTEGYNRRVEHLLQVLGHVPSGARLLPLRAPGHESETAFWHAQAYAVPTAHAFVPTLFQGVHALRLRPEWRDSAHAAARAISSERLFDPDRYAAARQAEMAAPSGRFWVDWDRKFTHILLLDSGPDLTQEDARLQLVTQTGGFALYRIAGTTR